jgi:hypothetical protein
MLLNLILRPSRIFLSALVLFFLCLSVDLTSAQILAPAERPNSLYLIEGKLFKPVGIVKRNEQLWVTLERNHDVSVIQPDGRSGRAIGSQCGDILCFPMGIALDSKGFLYIADAQHAAIRKFLGGFFVSHAASPLMQEKTPFTLPTPAIPLFAR